jgi:hypothetical protein
MRIATARSRPLGRLWGLLLGLALLDMSLHGSLAEADPTKGLPPRVESVLRWLPEDTETLVVARSFTVPNPDQDDPDKGNPESVISG